MSKKTDLVDKLKLDEPQITINKTNDAIRNSAIESHDILKICESIINQIPQKIELATSEKKRWTDINIPRVIINAEIINQFNKTQQEWYEPYECFWHYYSLLLKKEWFLETLIKKIVSNNYKCVLIKVWYGFSVRIAWCEDNSYISSFHIKNKKAWS